MSQRTIVHALFIGLAACGSTPSSRPIEQPTEPHAGLQPRPNPTAATSWVCLAGECRDGKGIATLDHGAARVIYDGMFVAGRPQGDATIIRIAGETTEYLEVDAKAGTGTLRHAQFTVLGEVTKDVIPQLSDESAAVMLPTGEWFFAEWTPTRVAARDSNLTGARSIPKLPADYGDMLAGVMLLENATHADRVLELRPPGTLPDGDGTKPRPFAPRIAIAPFSAFVPEPSAAVVYIVGIGVVDPTSPTIAMMRKGQTPTGAIPIIHADGRLANLEIKGGVVTRWPTWHTAPATWRRDVRERGAEFTSHHQAVERELANARSAVALRDVVASHHALSAALGNLTGGLTAMTAAAEAALEVAPGTEASRITRLRALRFAASAANARAELATSVVAAVDLEHPATELHAVLVDLVAQIDTSKLADSKAFQ